MSLKVDDKDEDDLLVWSDRARVFMRLVHVILDNDKVKKAFSVRDASEKKGRLFQQVCSKKFNDETFKPKSLVIPSLCKDFAKPVVFPLEQPLTPEQIQSHIRQIEGEMLILITGWERKENGRIHKVLPNGKRPQIGDFLCSALPFQKDNRSSFLGGAFESYVLYWWHMLDSVKLLRYSLPFIFHNVELSDNYVAPKTSAKYTTTTRRKRNTRDYDDEEDRRAVRQRTLGLRNKLKKLVKLQSDLRIDLRAMEKGGFTDMAAAIAVDIGKTTADIERTERMIDESGY